MVSDRQPHVDGNAVPVGHRHVKGLKARENHGRMLSGGLDNAGGGRTGQARC